MFHEFFQLQTPNLELWSVTIPYPPMLEEKLKIKTKSIKNQTKKSKEKRNNLKAQKKIKK